MKAKTGEMCPACESGHLSSQKRTVDFNYKGKIKSFKDVNVIYCDHCDFEMLSRDSNVLVEKELTDFRKLVDNLLSSDRMRSIRRRLGYNKKQMAELISVNDKTIGRYENGKITQSPQVDKLYRVLDSLPIAVKYISPRNQLYSISTTFTYSPSLKKLKCIPDDYNNMMENIDASAV